MKLRHKRNTYKLTKKLEYFYIQHAFAKRKYIKNPYAGKKRKTWNRLKEPFPYKWKRKLAKSDKGSYYNQGTWINEHEYGKGPYYNKYHDDDLDLVTNEESSSSDESEGKSHKDSELHEMFFTKEKLSTLVNVSLFANSSTLQSRKRKIKFICFGVSFDSSWTQCC